MAFCLRDDTLCVNRFVSFIWLFLLCLLLISSFTIPIHFISFPLILFLIATIVLPPLKPLRLWCVSTYKQTQTYGRNSTHNNKPWGSIEVFLVRSRCAPPPLPPWSRSTTLLPRKGTINKNKKQKTKNTPTK